MRLWQCSGCKFQWEAEGYDLGDERSEANMRHLVRMNQNATCGGTLSHSYGEIPPTKPRPRKLIDHGTHYSLETT